MMKILNNNNNKAYMIDGCTYTNMSKKRDRVRHINFYDHHL